ncbi:MAG: thioredoxin family protein [Alphaproteobacteria bacterium]|nr:thioredoxin family protein [Alphaproteobacteria bacterium]MDE2630742.1 thioredoxin family protein [Alphaproteobacteria bacterium]
MAMRLFRFSLLVLLAALAPAAAQIDQAPKVHARLIAEHDEVAPGGKLTVALEEAIRPGWHTYWSNPGEAGAPTEIKWTLPPGWKAGAIQWPYPHRDPVGPLMDYGYEDNVWLLVDLQAPAEAKPGEEVHLSAAVDWLVCREVCIPEDTVLNLTLFVGSNPPPPDPIGAEQFAAARAKLPVASPWPARFALGDDLRLYLRAPALAGKARPVDAQFFPARPGEVQDAAPQALGFAQDGIVLRLQTGNKLGKALDGVLVLTSADKSVQALVVKATPGAVPPARFDEAAQLGFALALFFAFVGGLILNVMPCVLPVLAMKALALAGHTGRAEARAESFAYSAGAVLSFVAFGVLLVALRAGGAAIGWGYQLQEPVVVAGLALLMFAVGLNLSGVFEVGGIAAGEGLARRGGLVGAFFTGVLAVAVAAPCTAPFMATAIGYGLTQSTPVVVAVFAALGLGFALPFLLLGLWPALHRILPKPGGWMLRLKQILAIPMYGAAAWLLWVLSQQVDRDGLVAAAAAMAALGVSLWLWGATRTAKDWIRLAGTFVAAAGIIGALSALTLVGRGAPPPSVQTSFAGIKSEPYSAARLDVLRRARRAVFVDATASWCITCLVNEEAALSRPAVRAAFADKHIALLVADWTNRNPGITALLEAHGRSGVPLYLYYAPGAGDAVVLPQVLTEGEVLRTIGAAR